MAEIWENMLQLNSPREAVCQWAVDNFDYLDSFIPNSYPRVIRKGADNTGLSGCRALLISIGAILLAVPATDSTCGASIWFVNLGYTLELVPLILKVAAINKLMVAAKKMKRVVVQRKSLFYGVAGVCLFAIIFLALWTGFDRPRKNPSYDLTDSITENEETI
eukprot:5734086-Ditylum_brightwellii.AAC.1